MEAQGKNRMQLLVTAYAGTISFIAAPLAIGVVASYINAGIPGVVGFCAFVGAIAWSARSSAKSGR